MFNNFVSVKIYIIYGLSKKYLKKVSLSTNRLSTGTLYNELFRTCLIQMLEEGGCVYYENIGGVEDVVMLD